MRIVVTVGMGRWPFDRLIRAIGPLCERHDVFAQTGTSAVLPDCDHARFVDPSLLERLLREADVVITHGGNTVRVVQRMGKVPIAVAREPGRGEMGNDHQVAFLASPHRGPVIVASGALTDLPDLVERHAELGAAARVTGSLQEPLPDAVVAARLDRALAAADGLEAWLDARHRRHSAATAAGSATPAPPVPTRQDWAGPSLVAGLAAAQSILRGEPGATALAMPARFGRRRRAARRLLAAADAARREVIEIGFTRDRYGRGYVTLETGGVR